VSIVNKPGDQFAVHFASIELLMTKTLRGDGAKGTRTSAGNT
jgi:hypothetical protein